MNSLKSCHKGVLWGMYIKSEYRGKGFADNLMKEVILHAKLLVMQLHLSCVTINQNAVQLYQKYGFEVYGIEPRALKIDDIFYDEYLMVLKF